ncbi:MAG: peptidase M28 [Gemmatimonadetes bacterium]|nr:MAG: peptidase M28 [Gemmatimonadota bacterium]
MILRTTFAAFATLSLCLAEPALAQSTPTFPTNDAVLRRIWSIGMDSSHVEELAATLIDSIGPRLTGTAIQRDAQNWLVSMYKRWGIDAKNEQFGTWRGWRRGPSHVDLLTPRVRTLEATMAAHSPGTQGKPLVAGTIILPHFEDSTEFVRWLPQARGKLVLASAPPVSCRPTSDFTQFATPETKLRVDSARAARLLDWGNPNVRGTGLSMALGGGALGLRLEEAGVAGLLTSRPKDALGAREIFETNNTRAPTVSLSCEDYGLVYRLTERGIDPQLRLDLDASFLGEQPVFNTIATIPGTEKPDEYVLLSAHFDSWDGASGATDNGTGTLTMMEAMRILKQVYPRPKRTIRVGHWVAEENGLVGSKAYREDHPEVVAGLQAIFNNDNGTGRISRLGATGFPNGDVHARQWLAKLPDVFRSQINYIGVGMPGTGGTDDFSFYCAGTPSFGLGGLGWNYGTETWHTDRDTYDKIVFDDLKKNATIAAMFAYLASEDPEKITRERVDLTAVADSIDHANALNPVPTGSPARLPALRTWPSCGIAAPRKTRLRL